LFRTETVVATELVRKLLKDMQVSRLSAPYPLPPSMKNSIFPRKGSTCPKRKYSSSTTWSRCNSRWLFRHPKQLYMLQNSG